jgi:serine/threonine-protein kinase
MIGKDISHYKILEKLGEGGMGVVYKAHDLKLDRFVALKFLPREISVGEEEKARFLQEARAASAVMHPNVCVIHDIQEHEGQQLIVMEYVDGKTLRQMVPIQKTQTAIDYAIQTGEALQEAHSKGVVHRDVKTDNIMVNSKNQIKVMDFGLAKLKGSLKLTRTSSTVGTLAYMAPEQIQGGEVDARSDIFSFGVVLYEMLTGQLPFRGEHEAAMMYSIVNEPPESLIKQRPDVSAEVERIVNRALEKDPEDRYQHVDDMVSELRRVKKQSSKVSRTLLADKETPDSSKVPQTSQVISSPKRKNRLPIIFGILAGVILLGIASYFEFFAPHKSIDTLAVLPFVNAAGDPNADYLSDGITESLINGLSQLSNLTVISRNSVFRYKGKEIDAQNAGKELSVKAVLTGRVTQRGDNLIISTELVDVSNNSHIWGEQYNRKLADIFSVQEEISKQICEKLRVKLAGEDTAKLTQRHTENTEAYGLYLKGRFYWNKRRGADLQTAVDYFNQAVEKDPNYALAYAGLASTYVILNEYAAIPAKDIIPKVAAAAKRATELDPTLAEPHAVLGLMNTNFEWDFDGAEREFRTAIELNPNYPTVHHWYCISLLDQGRFEESLREIKGAQRLDPLSPIINLNVADVLALMGRHDQAIEQYKKTLELDPNLPGGHQYLGLSFALAGRFDEAISELQKAREIVGADNFFALGDLGYVYAKAGKKEAARKTLNHLLEFSKKGASVSAAIAAVYAGLGEKDEAFEWLEKAYLERNFRLSQLKIDNEYADLRGDPRFHELLKKIGLEK